jgi:pilus assembly protein CpaE
VSAHLSRAQQLATPAGQAPVEAARPRGYLIACFSLRGGAGVSTLAVNLAVSLAGLWDRPCALVDLALTGGHASLLLNLPLKRTWADLASVPVSEFDGDFVEQHLSRHPSGVRVLASPTNPEDGELVSNEHVKAVLHALRAQYDYVVVDLPHDFRETSLMVLDAADVIVMPFPPDVASVRSAIAALHAFDTLKYAPEKTRLVLNWTFPKGGLAQADIERFLKHKLDLIIPYDQQDLIKAINAGQPIVLGTPAHPLAAMFEDYAFRISRAEERDSPPQSGNPHLQRVLSRKQARGATSKA